MKDGFYFGVGEKDRVYYGPFADREEAFKFAYFVRSVAERDRHVCYGHGARMLCGGIGQYEAAEMESLVADPRGCDYETVTVLDPSQAVEHASWKEFDEELKQKLLAEDLARAYQR